MIITLLILVAGGVVGILTSILPVASPLPAQMTQWVPYFHTGVQLVGFILPLTHVFAALTLFLSIQAVLIAINAGLIIWRIIRTGHF